MSKKSVKLSAKWQLDAALLSRPVDLNALVTLSKSNPGAFVDGDKTLSRIVGLLINEQNANKSDKDTKLDALNILANVAYGGKDAIAEVRTSLQDVSEWFDDYIANEEQDAEQEPELHKAMVLLIARCWNYRLKTEDVLELTRGNRRIALCTVVGLLEDGETYSTELKQRQRPGEGQLGQWEHELVVERYEKPLLMQICRLLRGFTHPGTYFEASEGELALYSVEKFADEMSTLLAITLRSSLVEKLSTALFECLFGMNRVMRKGGQASTQGGDSEALGEDDILEESDHIAVVSVNAFIQNLYFYASNNNEAFRLHILEETLFVPHLILPYLDRCILQVGVLNSQNPSESEFKGNEDEESFGWWTHFPQLVSGISSSLRTLIIATFRASQINLVSSSLLKLNPTPALLRATAFCVNHEYLFSLLCILNVNAGAVDISTKLGRSGRVSPAELLDDLAAVYSKMAPAARTRVHRRVASSGALPVSRDTASYVAMMSVLSGGEAGQLRYATSGLPRGESDLTAEELEASNSRAEAKAEYQTRMSSFISVGQPEASVVSGEGGAAARRSSGDAESKFEIPLDDIPSAEEKSPQQAKAVQSSSKSSGLTSLGDLPSLTVPKQRTYSNDTTAAYNNTASKNKKYDSALPKEFLCAINGHVMKDPVRSKTTDLVFERSTIELWLNTRGTVCPITNSILEKKDLVPDDELRNRIMRYHIQQTSLRVADSNNDDLYDF